MGQLPALGGGSWAVPVGESGQAERLWFLFKQTWEKKINHTPSRIETWPPPEQVDVVADTKGVSRANVALDGSVAS